MWAAAARYARALGARAAAADAGFDAAVRARAAAMAAEDGAAAAAAAARRARAPPPPPPPSAAQRAKPAPAARPASGPRKRAKKADSFIESEDAAGRGGGVDSEDEADWAPSDGGGGGGDDFGSEGEDGDSDAEWGGGGGGGGERRARRAAPRARRAAGAADAGRATRFAGGRMPARMAAALRGEDAGVAEPADLDSIPPFDGGGVPAPASPPMRFKVRLAGVAAPALAPAPAAAGGASPPRLVIKLGKRPPAAAPEPALPQVDGAGDSDDDDDLDAPPPARGPAAGGGAAAALSEGEAAGLPALLAALRRWLREPGAGRADAPPGVGEPHEVLARLELALAALGVPLEPLEAAEAEPAAAPARTGPLSSAGFFGEDGGETAAGDASGGAPLERRGSVGDALGAAARAGAAGAAGGAAAAAARARPAPPPALKKLSVKGRLMKKLRM
jgi:DNA polymerase-3 subunit gamma/tau